eukprot:TRINITY_DN72770_c0_g1_i1.p1 TRINITY_DN72770_c0_g1~~TRINITY_DN72770_c0_g1_i1.p1  ORF type:complete len:365 (-),score=49.04 TRINITY_DN72770_c0_g1_i1:115-1209(-)
MLQALPADAMGGPAIAFATLGAQVLTAPHLAIPPSHGRCQEGASKLSGAAATGTSPAVAALAAVAVGASRAVQSRRRLARSAESAVADTKKRKLISPQRRVQLVFEEDVKPTFFSINPLYESPAMFVTSRQRVWDYWMNTRPTREIERIDDGKTTVGCTWKQLDGRRGASFFSFNQEGLLTFIREVPEPAYGKFQENNMKRLQPAFGVMDTVKNFFNFAPDYLSIEDPNLPLMQPKFGLQAPRSRRACDVVRFLWDEAQYMQVGGVDKIMEQYSADAVYEDLTYEDSSFARGWDAVKTYMQETYNNKPEKLFFVLDEVSDGDRSCTALWHVYYNGQKSPRGVSYYELDGEGKIAYVRASYDVAW